MICDACGAQNAENADVCNNCGKQLEAAVPDSATLRPEADIYAPPEWLRSFLQTSGRLVKLLYVLAGVCFAIGLFLAIYSTTYADDEPWNIKLNMFLSPLLIGVFNGGVIIGFAALVSSFKRDADQVTEKAVQVLYFGAIATFLLGTTVSALIAADLSGYTSGSQRAQWFLYNFLKHAVLFSAVLGGFAAIISRREGYSTSTWPIGKVLYGTAVAALLIGIAIASLQVAIFDDAPGSDQVMVFLQSLAQAGLFYAGIIAGLGGVASLFNPRDARFYCSSCDNDVRDDWKLCPYCGDTLEETA